MAALSLDLYNMRKEERISCDELESYTFKTIAPKPVEFEAILQDKSNSGLGCFCRTHDQIKVGQKLNLWDMVVYEVRYAQKWSPHVMKLGLLITEELT